MCAPIVACVDMCLYDVCWGVSVAWLVCVCVMCVVCGVVGMCLCDVCGVWRGWYVSV